MRGPALAVKQQDHALRAEAPSRATPCCGLDRALAIHLGCSVPRMPKGGHDDAHHWHISLACAAAGCGSSGGRMVFVACTQARALRKPEPQCLKGCLASERAFKGVLAGAASLIRLHLLWQQRRWVSRGPTLPAVTSGGVRGRTSLLLMHHFC